MRDVSVTPEPLEEKGESYLNKPETVSERSKISIE